MEMDIPVMPLDISKLRGHLEDYLKEAIDYLSTFGNVVYVRTERAVIVGDIHGDLHTLNAIISRFNPNEWTYIFLGDYVDRGDYQVETLYVVLKLLLHKGACVLRGNHESPLTNFEYGFYFELLRKFGPNKGDLLYETCRQLFARLPIAAVLNDKYFLVHGGLPIQDVSIEDIERLPRPDELPSNEIAFQMLWNDPSDDVEDYGPNIYRGPGIYFFGPVITRRFLEKHDIEIVIRGHEFTPDGFKYNHNGKVLTIFTSRARPYAWTKPHIAVYSHGTLKVVEV